MKYKFLSLCIALCLILSLVGCGASANDSYEEAYPEMGMPMDMELNGAMKDEVMSNGNDFLTSMPNSHVTPKEQYDQNQKLVYTANLSIETLNFNQTIKDINNAVEKYHGFCENNSISDDSYDWYSSNYQKTNGTLTATMAVRIPTEHYNEFLNDAASAGKVKNKTEQVENITRRYNDTDTRIKTLTAEQEMLMEMMQQSTNMSDMIEIEKRLSDVTQELAVYQNQLNQMDTDVQYSTIYLNIREVFEYTYTPPAQMTFAEKVQEAIENSGETFVNVMTSLLLGLIFLFPYIIIVTIIVLICIFASKNKKQKKIIVEQQNNMESNRPKKESNQKNEKK